MALIKHHKYVAALPATLEANAIYYVRAGDGFDQYVTNSSGQIAAYPANKPTLATTSEAGLMPAADKTKLNGVQAGATANDTDANLRDRATHTGTQPQASVAGLTAALDSKLDLAGGQMSGPLAVLAPTVGAARSSVQVLRDVASVTTGSIADGTLLKITLPFSWTNTMLSLRLRGRSYAVGGDFDIVAGAYSYAASNQWFNAGAIALGRFGVSSVKFGHDGSNCCIVVQFSSSSSYCVADLVEVVLGYSGHQSPGWRTGWALSFISDETGINYTAIVDPKAQTREGLGLGSAALQNFNISDYSTTAQMQTAITSAVMGTTIITVTGTAATLGLTYVPSGASYVRATNTAAVTITVPANSTAAIQVGAEITLRRVANANLTVVAASGVVVNAPAGGTLVLTQNMTATLKKVATNEWDLIGQTVAA